MPAAVEEIIHEGNLYALIVRKDFHEPGIHFFTPANFSEQLAYIAHPAGHQIRAHAHRDVSRDVVRTLEVLVVRKGRLRIDLFTPRDEYIESHVVGAGDVVLLAYGGHGFEVIEDCEMFEVKQGPYLGGDDKRPLAPGAPDSVPK